MKSLDVWSVVIGVLLGWLVLPTALGMLTGGRKAAPAAA